MEVGGEDDDEPDELTSIEEDPVGACSAEKPKYSHSENVSPRGHLGIRSRRIRLLEPASNEPGLTEQSDDSNEQLGKSPPNWWDRPTYPVQCSEEPTDSAGGGAASGHAPHAWQTLLTQAQSELGMKVGETNDDQQVDEEFKELISQAPEAIPLPYQAYESLDSLADNDVGHRLAVQHQLSRISARHSEELTDSAGGGAASGHAPHAWQTLSELGVALHTDAISTGLTQAQSELGLDVRETNDDQQIDEEFEELIRDAPDLPVDKSPDPLADNDVGHRLAVQHQLSSAGSLEKLEQQVQELQANSRSAHQTAAQTSAEELRRQASQAQQERLLLLRTHDSCQADCSAGNPLDAFTTSFRIIPKDPFLCCICRREEIRVRILDCRHAHWCLDCFQKYLQHIRPPRCPICKRRMVSHEFI